MGGMSPHQSEILGQAHPTKIPYLVPDPWPKLQNLRKEKIKSSSTDRSNQMMQE